jgi:hypothetical protein
MKDIFTFLDVDPEFRVNVSVKHNVSYAPSNALPRAMYRISPAWTKIKPHLPGPVTRAAAALRRQIKARYVVPPPPMPDRIRRALGPVFRDDLLKLQDLIGRDLSRWLS